MLVQNNDSLTDSLTGVKWRATSIANEKRRKELPRIYVNLDVRGNSFWKYMPYNTKTVMFEYFNMFPSDRK